MYPVILSGGSGTRLWPLSRPLYPKQFLDLHSENTLFQETILRLQEIDLQRSIVICNEDHRFIVAENMNSINYKPHSILLEPMGRNTAPAIAAAALSIINDDADALLFILPADHIIEDIDNFSKAVSRAKKLAQEGYMVTFGIKPTCPHTGYGYIEVGQDIAQDAYKINAFKEKPDTKTAEEFIRGGSYLWNSGMFCFQAKTYLEELKKYCPDILVHVEESFEKSVKDLDFVRLNKQAFEKCADISIDYAIMEQTDCGAIVSLDAKWSDIGSWDALWHVCKKDGNSNVCKGDVIVRDTKNSFIHGEDRLVCSLGVENLIIVDTQDALLVANKDCVQDVKKITEELKRQNRKEVQYHRTVYRPWGHYDSICFGERDQVKRISVKPGAKLSLQKHFHRSEHWVIVKGTARIIKGDKVILASENESVYIPVGTVHALENPGKIMLEIIEVQTGSYLGEDDIVRLEDLYGRI